MIFFLDWDIGVLGILLDRGLMFMALGIWCVRLMMVISWKLVVSGGFDSR